MASPKINEFSTQTIETIGDIRSRLGQCYSDRTTRLNNQNSVNSNHLFDAKERPTSSFNRDGFGSFAKGFGSKGANSKQEII
jgi:hypothetical protein